jgi:hypothetical protein
MLRHADGGGLDSASGGAYAMVQDGQTDGSDLPRPGAVDLDVTVPRADSYVIWARVHAPDHDANSFLVSVDGEEATYWWLPPLASSEWRWLAVTDRGSSSPKQYTLAAGRHRLRFANREDGVALDQVLVTGATDDLPAGLPDRHLCTRNGRRAGRRGGRSNSCGCWPAGSPPGRRATRRRGAVHTPRRAPV